MSGRRRSAFWGVVFGYGGVSIALARNIIFVPVYLLHIPLPEYGAWLATGGALALLLINDFGLTGIVTQKASAAAGAGDFQSFGALAGSALGVGAVMALLLTALSLACLPLLPSMVALSEPEKRAVLNCFLIAVAANAVGIVGTTASSVIRSLQKSILAGSITLIADLVSIAVTLIALYAGKGLYAIALAMFLRSLIIALAAVSGMALLCRRTLGAKLSIRWVSIRDLLADSSRFFLTSIAMKMQSQANVFFVGVLLGPASAAIYSLTVRAHETVMMLIGQINGALLPSVTHLLGAGHHQRFRAVLQRLLLSLAAVTALAMTVTVTTNEGFLRLWVGHRVFGGATLSILMGVALFVSSLGYVAYDALLAQGRFRLVSAVFALTSTLHVLLLLLFLHRALWVAPLITLGTASLWTLVFWNVVKSKVQLTPSEVRGLAAQVGLIVTVSAAVAAAFALLYPPVNSWPALVLQALSCAVLLAAGYGFFSSTIRNVAREEIGMTLRLFSSATQNR
jgi:O-antigen/teichoic acid export membrane protein